MLECSKKNHIRWSPSWVELYAAFSKRTMYKGKRLKFKHKGRFWWIKQISHSKLWNDHTHKGAEMQIKLGNQYV